LAISECDKIYIVKYIDKLGEYEIAKSFGRNKAYIRNILEDIKQNGLYEKYKNMSYTEWEKIERRGNLRW
jgi:hypothetical protein